MKFLLRTRIRHVNHCCCNHCLIAVSSSSSCNLFLVSSVLVAIVFVSNHVNESVAWFIYLLLWLPSSLRLQPQKMQFAQSACTFRIILSVQSSWLSSSRVITLCFFGFIDSSPFHMSKFPIQRTSTPGINISRPRLCFISISKIFCENEIEQEHPQLVSNKLNYHLL